MKNGSQINNIAKRDCRKKGRQKKTAEKGRQKKTAEKGRQKKDSRKKDGRKKDGRKGIAGKKNGNQNGNQNGRPKKEGEDRSIKPARMPGRVDAFS